MAIQLIRKEERLKFEFAGSIIYYRRLDGQVRARLLNKHTKNGNLAPGSYVNAVLNWCVLGWDSVEDSDGTSVPFESDLIVTLPDEVQDALSDLVSEATATEVVRTGN